MSLPKGDFVCKANGYCFDYFPSKGWGFIQPTHKELPNDNENDNATHKWVSERDRGRKYEQVFCHYLAITEMDGYKKLMADQVVSFDIYKNEKGYNAQNVVIIGDVEDGVHGNC